MANKEKFLGLVSDDAVSNTVERAKERQAKRAQHRISQMIALNILKRLEELGWKQKDLAEKMGVSPQQVNRWVKGKENFTIETLVHIGGALKVELIQVKTLSDRKIQMKSYKEEKSLYEEFLYKGSVVFNFNKKPTASGYNNQYLYYGSKRIKDTFSINQNRRNTIFCV